MDYCHSEVAEKGLIIYSPEKGCNSVQTGTEEFDVTILEAMPFIHRFFTDRLNRDNMFEHYKDLVPPLREDDPTTASIALDEDDMVFEDPEVDADVDTEADVNVNEDHDLLWT